MSISVPVSAQSEGNSPLEKIASVSQPDLGIERLIRRELGPFYNRQNFQVITRWATYRYVLIDLNQDHETEALVYVQGATLCEGATCGGYVLKRQGENWQILGRFEQVKTPFYLKPSTLSWQEIYLFKSETPEIQVFSYSEGQYKLNNRLELAKQKEILSGLIPLLNSGPDLPIRPR